MKGNSNKERPIQVSVYNGTEKIAKCNCSGVIMFAKHTGTTKEGKDHIVANGSINVVDLSKLVYAVLVYGGLDHSKQNEKFIDTVLKKVIEEKSKEYPMGVTEAIDSACDEFMEEDELNETIK